MPDVSVGGKHWYTTKIIRRSDAQGEEEEKRKEAG